MKTIKKFTTKEVEKVFEKEIELPAYFCFGETLPSMVGFGDYFCTMVKLTDENKRGVMISCHHKFCVESNTYSFDQACFTNEQVLSQFNQVDESEWNKAVEYLKRDIDGK